MFTIPGYSLTKALTQITKLHNYYGSKKGRKQ